MLQQNDDLVDFSEDYLEADVAFQDYGTVDLLLELLGWETKDVGVGVAELELGLRL